MLNKINEINFENDEIIEYLRAMGYKKIESNTIGNDLIHRPSLIAFLKSGSNYNKYQKLLKDVYKNDIETLDEELVQQVKENMLYRKNTAITIRRGVSLHGERFNLIESPVGGMGKNPHFDNNIFAFANQYSYSVKDASGNIVFKRRPDIVFFLNGIYISLLELKYTNQSGQTAKKEGRIQILGDGYYSLIRSALPLFSQDTENKSIKQDILKIFEKPIHCVTMDDASTYLCRNMSSLYEKAVEYIKTSGYTEHTFVSDYQKEFRELPQEDTPIESGMRTLEALNILYSKESICREIIYYNFIINNKGLMAPRPKQKLGVDKTISHIRHLYKKENESDPQYHIRELKEKLDKLPISQDLKEQEYKRRDLIKNNKEHYSILLQYAAGFGKSNIISYLALMLKDEINEDNNRLFDKVVIVTDRLDLRYQIGQTVDNMNTHSSVYVEATNKKELIDAFNNSLKRVIILNIQKFRNIETLRKDLSAINDDGKRITFIVDEVHRSQSGVQHFNMLDIFDELYYGFNNSVKKHLIIGLTATPSDEVLARFGEYPSYENSVVKWMPFDTYTMKEAIEDGFVLDPTEYILTYGVPFDISERDKKRIEEGEIEGTVGNNVYYHHPERLKMIAENTVKLLFENCYPSIQGRGKGMLATYSKHTATALFELINDEIIKYREKHSLTKYKNAVVKVVFTEDVNRTGTKSARELNGGQSESDAIKEFKGAQNGLIIVVDKLQTGFDEPYLSYLFLDKEVSGINAVQTCCRVNRTAKNKDHCVIVDYSRDNNNESNIRNAFTHYENMVVTNIDPIEHFENIKRMHTGLTRGNLFQTLYEVFIAKSEQQDPNLAREFNAYIRRLRENDPEVLNQLLSLIGTYVRSIRVMKNLIEIDDKYIIDDIETFVKELRHVDNSSSEGESIAIESFTSISNVNREIVEKEKKDPFEIESETLSGSPAKSSINSLLLQLERNEITEELIAEWHETIMEIFSSISAEDENKYKGRLYTDLKSNTFIMDSSIAYFSQSFRKAIRKMRKEGRIDSKLATNLKEIERLLLSEYREFIIK
jgi:type I restriction enzyme R subunit